MSFLDQFLYKNIAKLGTLLSQQRPTINFLGSGVSVADNPTTKQTDVTITGGGGSSFGKINLTLANGTNSNQATDGSLLQVIGGPTATFGLGSVLPSVSLVSGQPVVFENTVNNQLWYLVHLDPSATGSSLKFSIPGQTQAGAQVPVFGKLSAHFDGTNLVADLGTQYLNEIDVRRFGAIPNLSDTASLTNNVNAITAALAYFQARVQAGASAFALVFPGGPYYVNNTAANFFNITNCVGGRIIGDGLTTAINAGFGGGLGVPAVLRLTNCQGTIVEGIAFNGAQEHTAITANCPAGSLSCTVSTGVATALAALTGGGIGLPVRLGTNLTVAVSGGYSEANVIASINTGTGVIGLATPTQRGYTTAATGQLIYGTYAGIQVFKDAGQSGDSNNVTVRRCGFGAGSVYALGYGVAFDCVGGTGSSSDADNGNHIVDENSFYCDIAAVKVGHRNSLLNEIKSSSGTVGSIVDSRWGGQATVSGGNWACSDVDIMIAGQGQHPTLTRGVQIESSSAHLRMIPIPTTVTNANYTQPTSGATTVVVTVHDTSTFLANTICTIDGGGVYFITAIAAGAPGTLTLTQDGSAGNASPTTVINSGAIVRNAPYSQRFYGSVVDKKFAPIGASDGAPSLLFNVIGGGNFIELHGGMYGPGANFSAISVVELRNGTYFGGPGSWFQAHGVEFGADQLILDAAYGDFVESAFTAGDTGATPIETVSHSGGGRMKNCKALDGAFASQYVEGVDRAFGYRCFHQWRVNNTTVGSLSGDDPNTTPADFVQFGATPAATGRLRLPNNGGGIRARNAGNTADAALIDLDASNVTQIADGVTSVSAQINLASSNFASFAAALINFSPLLGLQAGVRGAGVAFKFAPDPSPQSLAAGGTIALSSAHYQYAYLGFTGTLPNNTTVTLPSAQGGVWFIDLSGITFSGHTLFFQVGTNVWGTSFTATTQRAIVVSDGTKLFGIALTQ